MYGSRQAKPDLSSWHLHSNRWERPETLTNNQVWVIEKWSWKFPGGLVVKILGHHCRDPGSFPGQGAGIPQARWCSQNTLNLGRKKSVTELAGFCEDCMLLLEVYFCREALGHCLESGICAETWRMELARQTWGRASGRGEQVWGGTWPWGTRTEGGGGGRHAPAEGASPSTVVSLKDFV